ncbi:MAG: hypothetical protein AB7S92_14895 [Parvibaculaceae bacterium]
MAMPGIRTRRLNFATHGRFEAKAEQDMNPMRRRKIRIVARKLKRQRALGRVFLDAGVIEIDERQKPREWLSTLVHEALHVAFPDMEERPVAAAEKRIAEILWQAGVRRIHQ